jgi:hypothetical protein
MAEKHFTLEEADRLLPRLRPILQQLVVVHREMGAKRHKMEELRAQVRGNGATAEGRAFAKLKADLESMARELREGIEQIEGFGCLVKDLDAGLIDFPARRQGQEVLLCWKLGEESIAFWHTTREGFAGRKPLGGEFV